MMSLQSSGTLGRCLAIESPVESFPCSSSFKIAAAVICFVADAISKSVRSVFRTEFARSAMPYPLASRILPPRATRTAPENPNRSAREQ